MRKVLTAMNVVLRATESQNRAFSETDVSLSLSLTLTLTLTTDPNPSPNPTPKQVETFVKTLFEEAEVTNDRLNYDDFLKVVKRHPEIIDF